MYYFNPQISGTGLASTEFGCTKFYLLANGIAFAAPRSKNLNKQRFQYEQLRQNVDQQEVYRILYLQRDGNTKRNAENFRG